MSSRAVIAPTHEALLLIALIKVYVAQLGRSEQIVSWKKQDIGIYGFILGVGALHCIAVSNIQSAMKPLDCHLFQPAENG